MIGISPSAPTVPQQRRRLKPSQGLGLLTFAALPLQWIWLPFLGFDLRLYHVVGLGCVAAVFVEVVTNQRSVARRYRSIWWATGLVVAGLLIGSLAEPLNAASSIFGAAELVVNAVIGCAAVTTVSEVGSRVRAKVAILGVVGTTVAFTASALLAGVRVAELISAGVAGDGRSLLQIWKLTFDWGTGGTIDTPSFRHSVILALLLLGALIFEDRDLTSGSGWRAMRRVAAGSLVCMFFLAGSRSSFLALGVFLVLARLRRVDALRARTELAFLVRSVAIAVGLLVLGPLLYDRLVADSASYGARISIYADLDERLTLERVLLGGRGFTYDPAVEKSPHNAILGMLFAGGVISMTGMAWLFGQSLKNAWARGGSAAVSVTAAMAGAVASTRILTGGDATLHTVVWFALFAAAANWRLQ